MPIYTTISKRIRSFVNIRFQEGVKVVLNLKHLMDSGRNRHIYSLFQNIFTLDLQGSYLIRQIRDSRKRSSSSQGRNTSNRFRPPRTSDFETYGILKRNKRYNPKDEQATENFFVAK